MHWPYTLEFTESFMAAQWGAALLLTALLLGWRGATATRALLLVGIWVAATATQIAPSLEGLGVKTGPQNLAHVLLLSSSLGTFAALLALRPGVAVLALAMQVPLWWVTGFVTQSEGELAALHLAWLGLLVGILGRRPTPRAAEAQAPPPEPSYWLHDLVAFVAATTVAAIYCLVVMHRRDGSADEWGYTFQAAVFAKGRIYSHVPRCQLFLENFYVYESSGRMFSQYTPGWPMFIAPFMWIHAYWLAAPASLGLLAWGMARLGRTAMRCFGRRDAPPSARAIGAAGTWAALLSGSATSLITNAGSRYSHVYVLALYAWSLEALMQITTPGLSRRRQVFWGLVLGAASLHNVASRPADGAFVGIGMALLFGWSLVRRRVGWRAAVAAASAFAVWGALMLVILRLQIGKWFTTGYSLNAVFHPWNVVKYSKPYPHQWKYGLPLATGAYCWWPTSVPLGLAGLARMRGRALGLVMAMATSCVPYVIYCMYLDLGQRGIDWGYGPRYLMVLVVPMALGAAVALAPATVAALERWSGQPALRRAGPLALAVVAVVTAYVRIAPPEWATVAEHTTKHSALTRAIEDDRIHHATVVAAEHTTGFSDSDLTTNYPVDLYPDQDVLIAITHGTQDVAVECLRSAYPDRKVYLASGVQEVRITPAP